MEIFSNWRFWTVGIAICSFTISILSFIVNKVATFKIMNNDIRHINQDIKDIKINDKEFKKEIRRDIRRTFNAVRRIERKQVKLETVYEIIKKDKK